MMILDTNVISETKRPHPNPGVIGYLNTLDRTTTYITAITASELLRGAELLPDGRRKETLLEDIYTILNDRFEDRILPFDYQAATLQALYSAKAQRNGLAVSLADSMIAGIARVHSASVVTRDISPFEAMHVSAVNPWAPD